jgi:hypothetical protein
MPLKNVRETFLEKSSRKLVNSSGRALNPNGKPILNFNNRVNTRGNLIRNRLGRNMTRRAGIFSTFKIGKRQLPYTNGPESPVNNISEENAEAIKYRRITNRWSPLTRRNPRLNVANSKILANIHAAAAPNYNYDTMVQAVRARSNINDIHKAKISDRLHALYYEGNNDENENENDANLRAWVAASEEGRQRIVLASSERSMAARAEAERQRIIRAAAEAEAEANRQRTLSVAAAPEFVSLNTIRKKSAPKPSLPAYFTAQAKGMNGI